MSEAQDAFFARATRALARGTNTALDGALDNPRGNGRVCERINHNEASGGAILRIGIEEERQRRLQIDGGNIVQFELLSRNVLKRVDVHAMANLADARANGARGVLEQVNLMRIERFRVHPNEHGLKLSADGWSPIIGDEHVAAAQIDFVLERDGDGIAGARRVELVFKRDDRLHTSFYARRQGHDARSGMQLAGGKLTGKAAEAGIGTNHILHREAEWTRIRGTAGGHRFQKFEKRRAFEPGHAFAAAHDIIAFERADRHGIDIIDPKLFCELAKFRGDAIEYFLRKTDQIHFVH